ncbi:MAG: copper amine oxidase N-terminal domain-containing protein [Defluviitaleaceae bacterium]|nr:copper amine oxidase N-terminal domain-containing protein [Defluviitaleaceae bacterium]
MEKFKKTMLQAILTLLLMLGMASITNASERFPVVYSDRAMPYFTVSNAPLLLENPAYSGNVRFYRNVTVPARTTIRVERVPRGIAASDGGSFTLTRIDRAGNFSMWVEAQGDFLGYVPGAGDFSAVWLGAAGMTATIEFVGYRADGTRDVPITVTINTVDSDAQLVPTPAPTPTPVPTPVPVPPADGVGEIIQFGGRNWRVLDTDGNYALVISENLTRQMEYHVLTAAPWVSTWEISDVRRYLNSDFYNSFSASERARIRETPVINNDNPWYGISGGNNTTDRIFLLSVEEVVRFFGDSGGLQNMPASAAYFINARISDVYDSARLARSDAGEYGGWLLRSPGFNENHVTYVSVSGDIIMDGVGVRRPLGVRPALWLNLNPAAAQAEPAPPPVAAEIGVAINGATVHFADQAPANIDGRTLVPVRGVFEMLGFDVDWDDAARTAIITNASYEMRITIDSATFTTNGVNHTLDVPAQSIGGRTMVPIRLPLESVGLSLDWDDATRTVLISGRITQY